MKRQASAVLLILTAAWLLPDLVRCGVSPAAAAVDDRKPDAKTGTFRGLVIFDGTPPERETLLKKDDPKVKPDDRATCAADDQLSEDFLVNEEAGNGVANAVIYLQRAPDDY